MGTMASQITSLTIVYSTVYSGADQRNIKAPRHMYMWMNIYSHEHVYVCGHVYVYIVNLRSLNSIEHSTCKYK